MKKTTIITITSLLACSSAVLAAPTQDNHYQQDQGAYVGAQWLPGQEAFGTGGSAAEIYPEAAGFNVGYQFNRNLALEASFQGLYESTKWDLGYGIKGSESDEILFPAVDVKGILPLGKRVTFYGKAGAAVAVIHATATATDSFDGSSATDSASGSEFAPMLGAGIGIYMTRHLEASFDQTFYYLTKDKSVYGMTGVGLTYHI